MESLKIGTTASVTNVNKERLSKTYAQRQKEYRMRKKIQKQLRSPKKIPKTNAQHQQQFRQRLKERVQQNESLNLARKKQNAERAKRYRDKLKLKCAQLYSALSSQDDSFPMILVKNIKETNHLNNKKCERISQSELRVLHPINVEARQVPIKTDEENSLLHSSEAEFFRSVDSETTSNNEIDEKITVKQELYSEEFKIDGITVKQEPYSDDYIIDPPAAKKSRLSTPNFKTNEPESWETPDKKNEDEWYHLGSNVACQLRQLPLEKALVCQSQILEILMRARLDELKKSD